MSIVMTPVSRSKQSLQPVTRDTPKCSITCRPRPMTKRLLSDHSMNHSVIRYTQGRNCLQTLIFG